MTRSLIYVVLLVVLGFLFQQFLPWWILAPLAALLAWALQLPARQAFVASLAAGILLWSGYALYMDNEVLSKRLGQLMGNISPFFIFLLTGLIGGLLAAMGGVTGSLGATLWPINIINHAKTRQQDQQ